MDEMSKSELARLNSEVYALIADISRKTGIASMPTQMLEGATTTRNDVSNSLDEFDNDMSEGYADELPNLDPSCGGENTLGYFDERSSMWTDRQQELIWYYDNFGVIGLAYMVKEIARAELLKATGMEPRIPSSYRKRFVPAKRPPPSADIQVVNSQEEQVSYQPDPNTLVTELGSLVNAQGFGPKSWRRMFYDWYRGRRSRTLFYLSAIPDEVIRAILHGNLPERMLESSFPQRFGHSVRLDQRPGTYTVYLTRRTCDPQQATASSPHPGEGGGGLGLTLDELRLLHGAARRYIDLDDAAYVEKAVKTIDSAIGKFQDTIDHSLERRYGAGCDKRSFSSHRELLDGLESNLLKWAEELRGIGQESVLHIPLSRCFAYVGLSSNPLKRCPDHWTHSNEASPIFGMITAILQAAWPDRFDVRDHSYQIFRVVKAEDLGFAEILSSIISSAYHWDLGLSYTFAGAGGQTNPSEQLSSKFAENGCRIREDKVQVEQIKASVEKIEKMGTDWPKKNIAKWSDEVWWKRSLVRRSVKLQKLRQGLETQLLALQVRELEDALSIGLNNSSGCG